MPEVGEARAGLDDRGVLLFGTALRDQVQLLEHDTQLGRPLVDLEFDAVVLVLGQVGFGLGGREPLEKRVLWGS